MSEERMFILKMIEEGKITAEEGAALLEALRDEVFESDRPEERKEAENFGADRPSSGSDGRGEDEAGAGRQSDDDGEDGRDRRPRGSDIATQIKEAIQTALKGVPHVTDELKDNWKEVREDVRHSFHEIRDEIRKKGLVDVSGLMDLISHMRDVGFGNSHEFEEEVEGVLSDADPSVALSTTNGAITVKGWDKPGFRLLLKKRLQAVDEEKAKEAAQGMVDLAVDAGALRATARHMRNASVSMELWLPVESGTAIEARSENGSIRLEGVTCREADVTTTNGSIHVHGVKGERVATRTTNGKVTCSNVRSQRAEAKTTNGSVSWGGAAEVGEIRTVNGTARLELEAPDSPAGWASGETSASRYDVSTVNGSVHVELPDDDEVGISAVANGRSVRVEGDESRLVFDGNGRGERRGRTPGYDEAAKKLDLTLRTVNGSIRLHAASKGPRADEGGDLDAGGTDSNTQDA